MNSWFNNKVRELLERQRRAVSYRPLYTVYPDEPWPEPFKQHPKASEEKSE